MTVPLPASVLHRRAARLSSCVMSRLTPRLFPDRPVVSFMLQARRGGGQQGAVKGGEKIRCRGGFDPDYGFYRLQYFKRPWILQQLVESVMRCGSSARIPSELLVNVDNPSEHKTWAELAKNTSGAEPLCGIMRQIMGGYAAPVMYAPSTCSHVRT